MQRDEMTPMTERSSLLARVRLPGSLLAQPWRWLHIALAALLLVQLVRFAFAVLTPVSPVGDWQSPRPTEVSAAAQAALFARFDPFFRQQSAETADSAAITALPLQLFGVRSNAATGGGSAIIAGEDGVQNSIGVGEEIQPGVRLVGVFFDHVMIERNGARELLYLDQATSPAAPASPATPPGTDADAPAPPAASPPAAPLNPASVRAGVAFAPRSAGNRITGITVSPQGDGSTFSALGLRQGDVIRTINGRPIASAGDIAAFQSQLQPGARLSIEVERGADVAPIAIVIPNGRP
jgi:general secretion pathway protein C